MAAKPNLFIIGAQKSGTTSLYDRLSSHPSIFLSDPKEPGFFVPEATYYPSDEAWYLGLFEGGSGHRYRGEASTHYTKLPLYRGVPERIAAFVDEEPRFIYLMRDPIERTISHYWHNVRKLEEHLPLEEALRERVEYLAFSDYRTQLEAYFDVFGRDPVLALAFEDLVTAPDETVAGILGWLELDPSPAEASLERRNARPRSFLRLRGSGVLDRIARSEAWGRVSRFIPQPLKDAAKKLAYRSAEPDDEQPREVVEDLRSRMAEQALELEAFLGTRFPRWTTTFPERAGGA